MEREGERERERREREDHCRFAEQEKELKMLSSSFFSFFTVVHNKSEGEGWLGSRTKNVSGDKSARLHSDGVSHDSADESSEIEDGPTASELSDQTAGSSGRRGLHMSEPPAVSGKADSSEDVALPRLQQPEALGENEREELCLFENILLLLRCVFK